MLKRRVLGIFAAMLLLTATAFSGVGLAEDNISLDTSVSPESLAGKGQVTLTVTVGNPANNPNTMQNVRVERNNVPILRFDDVFPSDNPVVGTCQIDVSAAELGTAIPLKLIWTENDSTLSKDFSVTVASSAKAEPVVAFTRTLSATTASAGDKIKLKYAVDNTGVVDITNIKITDSGVGPDMVLTKSTLKAGSSTELNYEYTMSSDFTSAPKLTFTANGKTYSKTIPSKKVLLTQAELDAVLEVSPTSIQSGDEVTLLCTLTNSGNVQLLGLVIGDNTLGNRLFTLSKLDPGASKSFTKKVTLTETTSFQYNIKAKDAAGHDLSFKSNTASSAVQGETQQALNLEIIASSNTLQLSEPGKVTFEIAVTNKGADTVSNVKITDQDGNPITVIESLPPGKKTVNYDTIVEATTVYNFSLTVDDGKGGEYKINSGPTEISVVEATATPEVSAAPSEEIAASPSPSVTDTMGDSQGTGSKLGTLLILLVVVGVLIMVTAVVLVVMIVKDRKRNH